MISENYEGKVIEGKVITNVGVIPDLNVIHVNFSDDTFGRYGSVEVLEAVIEEVEMTDEEKEKAEVTRAAEVENERQEEEEENLTNDVETTESAVKEVTLESNMPVGETVGEIVMMDKTEVPDSPTTGA